MGQITSDNIETPSLKSRAVKGAVWIAFEMLGVQATSFIIFVVMAHYVELRDLGLISISYLAIQSLQMLFLNSVPLILIRKSNATDLEYTTTFWVALGVAVILFLLLMTFSVWAERLFHAPGLTPILRAMSVIVLFMGLARTHEAWLTRHFLFHSLALRAIFGALVGGTVGVVMAMRGYGVMALVGQQVVTSVASLILLWIACPWRPGFQFSRATAGEIFRFLRSITPNSAVYALNQNCDTMLVAYFFGPVSTGIYNVAKRVRVTLQLVANAPINGVTLPALSEIQHDVERLQNAILKALMLNCVICAPIFLGVSAVSFEAVSVIFGQKWIAAAPVLQLLSLSGLGLTLLSLNDNIFILQNRQIRSLYISLAYSGLSILLFIVGAVLQMHSIAMPFVLPYLLIVPLSTLFILRGTGLSAARWAAAMVPGIVPAVVMFGVILGVRPYFAGLDDLPRLFVLCLLGAVTYLMMLWCFWRDVALMAVNIGRQVLRKTQ